MPTSDEGRLHPEASPDAPVDTAADARYGFASRDERVGDETVASADAGNLAERLAESEEALASAHAERDGYLDDLKRVAADFDNFRKRAAREREETESRASERVVKEMLTVAEDLDRALDAAATHETLEEERLIEGVEMVRRQLGSILAKEGVAEVATDGMFDPHVHEALTSMESDADEGSVLAVISKGYTISGRLVRPARVIVARGKSPEEEGPH